MYAIAKLSDTAPITSSTRTRGRIQPSKIKLRIGRIALANTVPIYRLVAKDTIEEKILDLHQHKRDLADSLLEGTHMSGKISTDELLRLIQEK